MKCNNNLSSFWLHYIINFVLTEPKLAQGPVKFPAHSISHFVMNIVMADWLNRQLALVYIQTCIMVLGEVL